MRFWLLTQKDEPDWDEVEGLVIAAKTSEQARLLAAENAGDEKPETWISHEASNCFPLALKDYKENEIILRSFISG